MDNLRVTETLFVVKMLSTKIAKLLNGLLGPDVDEKTQEKIKNLKLEAEALYERAAKIHNYLTKAEESHG